MEVNKETKIGVVCGGISSEREISLRSGKNCFNALLRLNYNVHFIDIKETKDIFNLKENKIEVAFLLTHGKFGEDGAIQGILEWLRIPYTGSSVTASAICMDKWLTKQIAKTSGIATPNAILIKKDNYKDLNIDDTWNSLSKKCGALFVKPKDDGSSVNTYKVKRCDELRERIKKINLNESDYMLEEFVAGREITVSIIEINNHLKVLPTLELKPKNEFYDYHAKYTKGMTEFILPAKIEQSSLQKIENNSIKIFSETGCSSFGRIDYILDSNNEAYLLEINSLPGMTDTSDLPAQALASGIKYDELVEIILKTARLHNYVERIT